MHLCLNSGNRNEILTMTHAYAMPCHARENMDEWGIFWAATGLWSGPQGPLALVTKRNVGHWHYLRLLQWDFSHVKPQKRNFGCHRGILVCSRLWLGLQQPPMHDSRSLGIYQLNLSGGVGICMNLGCQNIILTIRNKARKIAAVLRVFWAVSSLWFGPLGPQCVFQGP